MDKILYFILKTILFILNNIEKIVGCIFLSFVSFMGMVSFLLGYDWHVWASLALLVVCTMLWDAINEEREAFRRAANKSQ